MLNVSGSQLPEGSTSQSIKKTQVFQRFARTAESTEKECLQASLASLEHATLSAMAERVFFNSANVDNTTDSEGEEQERKEHHHFVWRTQARPALLPLVGEPTNLPNQTTSNTPRELSLSCSEVPKNPWKVIRAGAYRRRNTFESGGYALPEKRRVGDCDNGSSTGPTNRSSADLSRIVGEGSLIELIDAEGKLVQLRERPDSWQCCSYVECQSPAIASSFKTVRKSTVSAATGFDWRPFVGRTLCNSCYSRMSKRGTLAHHPKRSKEFHDKAAKRNEGMAVRASVPRKPQNTGCFFSAWAGGGSQPEEAPKESPCSSCEVCFDPDSAQDLTCVKCGVSVHEQCYLGGERVSSAARATWTCDPCSLDQATMNLSCILCPLRGGAFKRAACGGAFQWAHLACAINIPGLYMMDEDNLDDIRGLEDIPASCRDHECMVCQRNDFFCVACDDPSCKAKCHPLCGVKTGWEMRIVAEDDQLNQTYRCPQHSSRACSASTDSQVQTRVGGSGHNPQLGREIKCPTCAEPWDGEQFMIRCDTCSGFFHGSCVLVSEQRANAMTQFTCPKCPAMPKAVDSEKRRSRLKHRGSQDVDFEMLSEWDAPPPKPRPPRRRSPGTSKSRINSHGQSAQKESEASQNVVQHSSAITVQYYDDDEVAPGRRVMFSWNESEAYEGVVICRANALPRKRSRVGVKRRTFGHDWWQLQWTADGGAAGGHADGGKDIVLLSESNRERWKLISENASSAAAAKKKRKAQKAILEDAAAAAGGSKKLRKEQRAAPSQPPPKTHPANHSGPAPTFEDAGVPVFCTGNGHRTLEATHGVLKVSAKCSRHVVVEHEGRELSLTDFEAIAGNTGKRPKSNIRVTATKETIAEYLKKNWSQGKDQAGSDGEP